MTAASGRVAAWRYRVLLASLLTTFIVQPLFVDVIWGQALLVSAYVTILTGGIFATDPSRRLSIICLVLAACVFGLSWYALYFRGEVSSAALFIVTLFFGVLAVARTLTVLVSSPDVNQDALAGAVFGYFLLVVVWALLFRAIEFASPGAFNLGSNQDTFTELLYFSLVSVTTLGYGDVTPITPFARISAGLEAATGTLYVAILIARIVGALGGLRK